MNRSARVLFAAMVACAFTCLPRPARAQTAVRAVVTADRTNLRAQPSRDAEVLASLIKGEPVEVLGVVTPKGSKEAWSRVALPTSVKVWLYGPLVDKAGLIRGETGNYRAGPGRNYSILGNLRRGDSVKVVREFDGWVQIEPPAGAVAYVASRLLDTRVPTPAAAVPVPEPEPDTALITPPPNQAAPLATKPPAPEPVVAEPVPAAPTPVASLPVTEPAPLATDSSPSPAPAAAVARPGFGGSPRDQSNRPPVEEQHPIMTSTDVEPTPLKMEPPPSRQVHREGIVRSTFSPQAPTHYELRDGFSGEGTIDYLYLDPQKELEKFSGKRVLVSGEEYRDSRWRTPVLKIKTIELAP